MNEIDEPDEPWFVATSLDEDDGWHFEPPDAVATTLQRSLPAADHTDSASWRGLADTVSAMGRSRLTDADLVELVDEIAAIAEESPGDEDVDARGRLALLLVLMDEAHRAVLKRVRRARNGGYRLRFGVLDRALVNRALDRLDELLGSDDASLARLFPNPYPDDPERAEGWKVMVTDDLIDSRREGLTIVRDLLGRKTATESEVLQLLRTLNDTRLMLGTYFDVSEDEPLSVSGRSEDLVLAQAYNYVGFLVHSIIAAMSDPR